ncbi:MAG: hypothetical protein IPJ65_36150 [Archangiaceae bacterium]|nr:hypothetical protein [Archangiaceae bacterium]
MRVALLPTIAVELERAQRGGRIEVASADAVARLEVVARFEHPVEGRVVAVRDGEGLRFAREGAADLQHARASTLDGLLGAPTSPRRPASAAAWSDPVETAARLAAVVAHQNQLRTAKHLPQLSLAQPAVRSGEDLLLDMPDGYSGDETIAASFAIWGDALMRATYGDLFSLNTVYAFDGDRLVSATPYAQWAIENLPGDPVQLYRQLDPREEHAWKSGALEQLGRDWGHVAPGESAPTPVVFFSSDREQTSAAGAGTTLAFTVSKAALLDEARRGALWSSATEMPEPQTQPVISEVVLPARTVRRLAERGALKLEG